MSSEAPTLLLERVRLRAAAPVLELEDVTKAYGSDGPWSRSRG
jgi:hypothetical protein